jgi:hypothetical protein
MSVVCNLLLLDVTNVAVEAARRAKTSARHFSPSSPVRSDSEVKLCHARDPNTGGSYPITLGQVS